MPPRRSAAQNAKSEEKAALHRPGCFTVTIAASEANIQRIAALLLFSDQPPPDLDYSLALAPLPGEDVDPPAMPTEADLIDYATVRREITRQLGTYVTRFGVDKARSVLASFGGERLALVGDASLLELHRALEAALA